MTRSNRRKRTIDVWSYQEKTNTCTDKDHKDLPHFDHTYRMVRKAQIHEELKLNDLNDLTKGFTVCMCYASWSLWLGGFGGIPNHNEYMEKEKKQRIEYWNKRLTLPIYQMEQAIEKHRKWKGAWNNSTEEEKNAYRDWQLQGMIKAVKNWGKK